MPQIKVGDIPVEVVRKDIKNLHLAVYPPTGRVRIATPLKIDDEAVRLFGVSKLSWIRKHQKNFKAQERQTKRKYVSGESHYFRGRRYLLNLIEENFKPKVVIKNKKYIDLYLRPKSKLEKRESVVREWYREQLKEQVPGLIDKWKKVTGIKVDDWGVKRMKAKWGTCNISKRRIWLNLELAKKPEHCIEYIILHEMMHLKERKHNDRYVALMDKYMPRWRAYKTELNKFIL